MHSTTIYDFFPCNFINTSLKKKITFTYLSICHALKHAGSQFPDQGLNLPPALGVRILSQWTTREVPRYYILEKLLFTTRLRGRYRNFPQAPQPFIAIAFPVINIPHLSGKCLTINELTSTHHYYPNSRVYIRVHTLCYTSNAFRQM